ncbi:M23 family metallopeptidase [Thermocrinis sp.]
MRDRYRYRPYSYRRKESPLFIRLIRRVALLSLVFVSFYLLFVFMTGAPELENVQTLRLIPAEGSYVLKAKERIREVEITVEQGGKAHEVFKKEFPEGTREVEVRINSRSLGLREGDAVVRVRLGSGFLRKRQYVLDSKVDLTPPSLEIASYTKNLWQGSAGSIAVKSDGAEVEFEVNGLKVRMVPVGIDGYFALFPVPIDAQSLKMTIIARDLAGNVSKKELLLEVKKAKFGMERIVLTDTFINSVIIPFLGETLSPEEAFKKINEDWRQRDFQRLTQLCQKSEPVKLWKGEFIWLPNSKVVSTYGIERFYYYQGRLISQSRHMGYDFASVERAPVPASNDGVVVFVGDLGIYGRTVLIDHGLGLFSLYGHLSEVQVKEGQFVKKGEIIGNTGKTGLALGDHLHFGILVHGYEVNPIYWFDANWIKNHIEGVLGQ